MNGKCSTTTEQGQNQNKNGKIDGRNYGIQILPNESNFLFGGYWWSPPTTWHKPKNWDMGMKNALSALATGRQTSTYSLHATRHNAIGLPQPSSMNRTPNTAHSLMLTPFWTFLMAAYRRHPPGRLASLWFTTLCGCFGNNATTGSTIKNTPSSQQWWSQNKLKSTLALLQSTSIHTRNDDAWRRPQRVLYLVTISNSNFCLLNEPGTYPSLPPCHLC